MEINLDELMRMGKHYPFYLNTGIDLTQFPNRAELFKSASERDPTFVIGYEGEARVKVVKAIELIDRVSGVIGHDVATKFLTNGLLAPDMWKDVEFSRLDELHIPFYVLEAFDNADNTARLMYNSSPLRTASLYPYGRKDRIYGIVKFDKHGEHYWQLARTILMYHEMPVDGSREHSTVVNWEDLEAYGGRYFIRSITGMFEAMEAVRVYNDLLKVGIPLPYLNVLFETGVMPVGVRNLRISQLTQSGLPRMIIPEECLHGIELQETKSTFIILTSTYTGERYIMLYPKDGDAVDDDEKRELSMYLDYMLIESSKFTGQQPQIDFTEVHEVDVGPLMETDDSGAQVRTDWDHLAGSQEVVNWQDLKDGCPAIPLPLDGGMEDGSKLDVRWLEDSVLENLAKYKDESFLMERYILLGMLQDGDINTLTIDQCRHLEHVLDLGELTITLIPHSLSKYGITLFAVSK